MNKQKQQHQIKKRRARRTRVLLRGTALRPRISVYKSNTYLYIQCIDDDAQKTILGGSTAAKDLRSLASKECVQKLVSRVATMMREKGVSMAIFDRGAYRFHGTVRMIAEGLRKSGIHI